MRVAAVDCGTNSLRLLIADVTGQVLTEVDRRMEVVRLGEGVDRTGRIADKALARAGEAAGEYAGVMRDHGVENARMVATSATRDASNAEVFVEQMQDILGLTPQVISGEEEAELSFRGALAGLGGLSGPGIVVDLGGGSTELVLGDADTGVVESAHSMRIGCVRLTERHELGKHVEMEELIPVRADIDDALRAAQFEVPVQQAQWLVGVAGTVTTVTAHALRLPAYDSGLIHGTMLGADDVLAACAELVSMPVSALLLLPYMHPGRADVIGAGALVWANIVQAVAREAGIDKVTTSEHDILDGIALAVGAG